MKYVFFDLDGTLTDPGEGITNSVAYAIRKMGEEAPAREELYKYIGPPLVDMFMSERGYSESEARLALKYYREYFTEKGIFENQIYPGVETLLKTLKDAGKQVVLATSKPQPFAETILRHFGIFDFFDFVAGSTLDETRTKKYEVIRYAVESLDADLNQIVMVGDRKHDVEGAHTVGIKAIGVLYGYGDAAELTGSGADQIAATVEELSELLLS